MLDAEEKLEVLDEEKTPEVLDAEETVDVSVVEKRPKVLDAEETLEVFDGVTSVDGDVAGVISEGSWVLMEGLGDVWTVVEPGSPAKSIVVEGGTMEVMLVVGGKKTLLVGGMKLLVGGGEINVAPGTDVARVALGMRASILTL